LTLISRSVPDSAESLKILGRQNVPTADNFSGTVRARHPQNKKPLADTLINGFALSARMAEIAPLPWLAVAFGNI
jgi:hypothetical protein